MGDVGARRRPAGLGQKIEDRHLVRPLVAAGLVERADHLDRARRRDLQPRGLLRLGLLRNEDGVARLDRRQLTSRTVGELDEIDLLDLAVRTDDPDLPGVGEARRTAGVGEDVDERRALAGLERAGLGDLAHDVDSLRAAPDLLDLLRHEDRRARLDLRQQRLVAAIEIGLQVEDDGLALVEDADLLRRGVARHAARAHDHVDDRRALPVREGCGRVHLAENLDRGALLRAVAGRGERAAVEVDLHVAGQAATQERK